MTDSPDTRRLGDTAEQRLEAASKLLRVGAVGPRRAVDDLIDRLARGDAADWLPRVLEAGPLREVQGNPSDLAAGRLSIAQLEVVKDRSKTLLGNATSSDDRLAGLAGYFLAIASGLRHHHTLIGGRGRGDLVNVLLDLAEFAPPPFGDLLCGATLVDAARGS